MGRFRSADCRCTSNFSCGVCAANAVARNSADYLFYPQSWFPGPHPSPAAVEREERRRQRALALCDS